MHKAMIYSHGSLKRAQQDWGEQAALTGRYNRNNSVQIAKKSRRQEALNRCTRFRSALLSETVSKDAPRFTCVLGPLQGDLQGGEGRRAVAQDGRHVRQGGYGRALHHINDYQPF